MDLEKINGRHPTTFDSGIIYTVAAILYVYVGGQLAKLDMPTDIYLILAEALLIAAPAILFAGYRHYNIVETFRFKLPRPIEVLIMLLISPIMIVAGMCAGFVALIIIKNSFGSVLLGGETSNLMSGGIIWSLFLIALIPAFCEEILFRGFIQRGMERLGIGWSVFLSGLLFGLFHFDFQRFAAQALIGFISAYAVYRTGSIFNGMILHFMNNGFLTLFLNYSMRNLPSPDPTQQQILDPFNSPDFIKMASDYGMTMKQFLNVFMIGLLIALAISLFLIFGLLIALKAVTNKKVIKPEQEKGSAKGLLFGIPGLLLILSVYTAIGLTLLKNPAGREILNFLGLG